MLHASFFCPQAKPCVPKTAGRLFPLRSVRMQAGESAKTWSDVRVKLQQSWLLRRWRVAMHAVEEAAMPTKRSSIFGSSNDTIAWKSFFLACTRCRLLYARKQCQRCQWQPPANPKKAHGCFHTHLPDRRRGWSHSNRLTCVQMQKLAWSLGDFGWLEGYHHYHSIIQVEDIEGHKCPPVVFAAASTLLGTVFQARNGDGPFSGHMQWSMWRLVPSKQSPITLGRAPGFTSAMRLAPAKAAAATKKNWPLSSPAAVAKGCTRNPERPEAVSARKECKALATAAGTTSGQEARKPNPAWLICWGLPLAPLTLLLGTSYLAAGANRQTGFGYNRVVARPASWFLLVGGMRWALRSRPQPALQHSSGAAASFAAIWCSRPIML